MLHAMGGGACYGWCCMLWVVLHAMDGFLLSAVVFLALVCSYPAHWQCGPN